MSVNSERRTRTILDLEDAIASLPPDARATADRIFTVSTTTGRLDAPAAMHFSRSPFIALAVRAIIGRLLNWSSARIAFVVS